MLNRRGFAEATSRAIEREANAGRPATVLIFDIDHFKSVNDRFGHPAGDEVLRLFATIVLNTLRITDLSGRIGGEEFAAFLPCSLEEAVIAAERVRETFESSGIVVEEGPVDTTVSIGVAGGPAGTELEVLLARPTPRSIRPSAMAATASRRPRSCHCRWKSGGARPRATPPPHHRALPLSVRHSGAGAGVTSHLPFAPYHLGHGYDAPPKLPGCPDVARSRGSIGAWGICLHVLDIRRIRDRAESRSGVRWAAMTGDEAPGRPSCSSAAR